MKHVARAGGLCVAKSTIALTLLTVLATTFTVAQPRFTVPLTVTDGAGTTTLYFGIKPGAGFCILEADSLNGHQEFFLPPIPPAFDSRFVWPRSGNNLPCFDQGSSTDIRPWTVATQKDTFRIKSQLGEGSTMVIRWPAGLNTRFTQLTIRFIGQTMGTVNTDMLANDSVDITDAGDPAIANIFSGGLIPTSVEQTSPDVPGEFALNQNYPNPFNPTTAIPFAIQRTAATDVSVYNLLGQKVATLTSELLTPGYYTARWDGKNSTGSDVSSGVYFVRLTATVDQGANFSAMRKLLLMK